MINYPNVNTFFLTQWGLGIILQYVEAHTWTIAKYQNMPINAYKNHLPKLTSVKAMEGTVVLWPFQHMSIK